MGANLRVLYITSYPYWDRISRTDEGQGRGEENVLSRSGLRHGRNYLIHHLLSPRGTALSTRLRPQALTHSPNSRRQLQNPEPCLAHQLQTPRPHCGPECAVRTSQYLVNRLCLAASCLAGNCYYSPPCSGGPLVPGRRRSPSPSPSPLRLQLTTLALM